MKSKILQLADYINQAKVIVFYGGAGVSTESGIPDYRGRFGLWTKLAENDKNPQYFAHVKRMIEDPEAFFAARKTTGPIPEPNATHKILANLEMNKKDLRVITQNVDGLHQQAGHRYVDELHGEHRHWHCMTCQRTYLRAEVVRDEKNVPRCYVCVGIVRPNVVYFGENAPKDVVRRASYSLSQADLLIIAGTSLTTPLAKRLIHEFTGKHIIVINYEPLDISPLKVDLYIDQPIAEVFTLAASHLENYKPVRRV